MLATLPYELAEPFGGLLHPFTSPYYVFFLREAIYLVAFDHLPRPKLLEGRQPTYRVSLEPFCCIHVAAEDAAEAVRLLEIYRRASGLTPESLAALKRYRRIYEVAQLVLVEYYSHPEGLTPTALENFFKVTEET